MSQQLQNIPVAATLTYGPGNISINGGPPIPFRSAVLTSGTVHQLAGSITREATESQIAYMQILAYERCEVTSDEDIQVHLEVFRRMSNAEASAMISLWQNLTKTAKAPQHMYDHMEQVKKAKAAQLNTGGVQTTTGTGNQGSAFTQPAHLPHTFQTRPSFVTCGICGKVKTDAVHAQNALPHQVAGVQQMTAPAPQQPATAPPPMPTVPLPEKGYYAVQLPDPVTAEMTWQFYRVTESRQQPGRRFIVRQHGDMLKQIDSSERLKISLIINADPKTRQADYGKQIGRCGKCGKTLTDPMSISFGIGPECRKSF